MNKQNTSIIATLGGVASLLLWSTIVGSFRVVAQALGTLRSGAILFLLAGFLACLPSVFSKERRNRLYSQSRAYWGVCGGLFVTYMVSFYLAIGFANGSQQVLEIGLVNYLWPSLTLLFSIPMLACHARWPLLPGILFASVGLVLAVGSSSSLTWNSFWQNLGSNKLAYILALVAAFSWGAYNNASRRFGRNGGGTPVLFLSSGLVLLLLSIFFAESYNLSRSVVIELGYLVVFPTLLAYSFWERGMREGNFVLLASLAFFMPVVSTLYSCFRLSIQPGMRLWVACAFIVAGAVACKKGVLSSSGQKLVGE